MRCQYLLSCIIGCISVQYSISWHIQYRVSRGEPTGETWTELAGEDKSSRHSVVAKILGSWYLPCLSYHNFRKHGTINRESATRSRLGSERKRGCWPRAVRDFLLTTFLSTRDYLKGENAKLGKCITAFLSNDLLRITGCNLWFCTCVAHFVLIETPLVERICEMHNCHIFSSSHCQWVIELSVT